MALSQLEANHKLLCLRCTIMMEGLECINQILFEGCNVPGESQDMATNQLLREMKDRLNRCI